MKLTGDRTTEPLWLYALAGGLLLGGPVWHYLFVNRYPFDRPEAVLLPVGAALIGAAIAMAAGRIGGWIGTLIFAGLLFIFVDLQFAPEATVGAKVAALGCFAVALILRKRRALITCLSLGAFDLASLPRPLEAYPSVPEAAGAQSDSLPVLLHLVLDEQWGIGGLRAAGDSTAARFLTRFYLERGFEVYEGAYSRWLTTRESIAETVSFGAPIKIEPLPAVSGFRLRANPYFERLHKRGYRIEVYQSSYLDYCRWPPATVASCQTTSGNSIANLGYLGGHWWGRAYLAGRYFLNATSHVYKRLKRPADARGWRQASVGGALAQLERVRDAIAAGKSGGTAFFVHVLLPHRPLEVGPDCRAYSDPDQRVSYEWPKGLEYRGMLRLYVDQVYCAHRAVADLISTLDRAVGRDRAIVIVHGDHGWRMRSDLLPLSTAELKRHEINSWFSSLLAIRLPRVSAALHSEAVPIQDFFWKLALSDFTKEVRTGWTHYVNFPIPKGSDWKDPWPPPSPVKRPLGQGEMIWAAPIR